MRAVRIIEGLQRLVTLGAIRAFTRMGPDRWLVELRHDDRAAWFTTNEVEAFLVGAAAGVDRPCLRCALADL